MSWGLRAWVWMCGGGAELGGQRTRARPHAKRRVLLLLPLRPPYPPSYPLAGCSPTMDAQAAAAKKSPQAPATTKGFGGKKRE